MQIFLGEAPKPPPAGGVTPPALSPAATYGRRSRPIGRRTGRLRRPDLRPKLSAGFKAQIQM